MFSKILVVEDDDDDFLLIQEYLSDYDDVFQLDHCHDYETTIQRLSESVYDACIIDYFIGDKTGLDVVKEVIRLGFQGPLILLTGADISEGVDDVALAVGADDYIEKSELSPHLLKRTIRYNLQRKKEEMRFRMSEAKYRQLAEISSSTLHNIGNVLNGLSVSAQTIDELADKIDPARLRKVAELLENQGLLKDHPKASLIPEYIRRVHESIHEGTLTLKESLRRNMSLLKIATQAIHVQQNSMKKRNDPYPFKKLLEEAISIQRQRIIQQDIKCSITGLNPKCCFDRSSLLHVLINLIKNAVDAMIGKEEKHIMITTKSCNMGVQIEVADTGQGMSPDTLSNLFEHGFTTKPQGNGFGLHFCRQVLGYSNASIEAMSQIGVGSKFVINIPINYFIKEEND